MAYIPQDKFAKKAKEKGYRARSAYKLLDLQSKYNLIKKSDTVLDLGAAPGSWMQVASGIVGDHGKVVGIDITAIEPLGLNNVQTFQKSILDEDFLGFLQDKGYGLFNAVIADVAPNTTGVRERDQGLSHEVSIQALEVAIQVLKKKGNFVVKVFEGSETPMLIKKAKRHFSSVHIVKPVASTKGSKETFLVAIGFLANGQKG